MAERLLLLVPESYKRSANHCDYDSNNHYQQSHVVYHAFQTMSSFGLTSEAGTQSLMLHSLAPPWTPQPLENILRINLTREGSSDTQMTTEDMCAS